MASSSLGGSVESVPSVVPTAALSLTDMPTEVLVLIISYLDTRSMVHLRVVCQRLRALTSDPINWSTISWVANSYIEDVNGLKFALRVSKRALKSLSLSSAVGCHFHMYKCIGQILSCRDLQSVSLKNVVHTEKQISKLLTNLPNLTFLHLNDVTKISFLKTVAQSGCQLKTLSFSLTSPDFVHHIEVWSSQGYIPPNLLIQYPKNVHHVDLNADRQTLYRKVFLSLSELPPSTNHSAYLGLQLYTPENFACTSYQIPRFLFQLTPDLSVITLDSTPMILTADKPGCREFSGGEYSPYFGELRQDAASGAGACGIGYQDVCQNLTSLRFCEQYSLKSDQLESWAQLVPNLVHLSLDACGEVLSDLKGLAAVNAGCPNLKELSLLRIKKSEVECLDGLWKILSAMSHLKVLLLPLSLIPICDPIPMNLRVINIVDDGDGGTGEIVLIEAKLNFLTKMPSLKVFKCHFLQPATIFHGFSRILSTSPLTHLSISLSAGSRLTLPADPSCYTHLQQMFLHSPLFVVQEVLANALTRSKNLELLDLRVASVEVEGITITALVNSLKSLSVLRICTDRSTRSRRTFRKSLTDMAKRDGRMIEINLTHYY